MEKQPEITLTHCEEDTSKKEGGRTAEAVSGLMEGSSEDVECNSISHVEVMKQIKQHISDLLADPFLKDLPKDIAPDEAKSQLALEEGKAIILYLRRYDNERVREYSIVSVYCRGCIYEASHRPYVVS